MHRRAPLLRSLLVACVTSTAVVASSATAAEPDLPIVVVAMGDSYASGEGGRWEGNSATDRGDRNGTDRAAFRFGWFWLYDPELVYGDSYENGCNRSDVAPILSANVDVDVAFNIACSGAGTEHVLPASVGGQSFKGEAPQIDQLAEIASYHDVEAVVVSVGGNDLGFTDIIVDCVTGYSLSTRWRPNTCADDAQKTINAELPGTLERLGEIIDETRAVLDANGDSQARIIVQGYPSPVADPDNIRFVETGWDRTFNGGCPLWDSDLEWATSTLIPTITNGLSETAAASGAEFVDMRAALQGSEACAATASPGSAPDGAGAEWIRFITTGLFQGDAEESAHPNAYGQRAMGRCLALALATPAQTHRCANTPGGTVDDMVLE